MRRAKITAAHVPKCSYRIRRHRFGLIASIISLCLPRLLPLAAYLSEHLPWQGTHTAQLLQEAARLFAEVDPTLLVIAVVVHAPIIASSTGHVAAIVRVYPWMFYCLVPGIAAIKKQMAPF